MTAGHKARVREPAHLRRVTRAPLGRPSSTRGWCEGNQNTNAPIPTAARISHVGFSRVASRMAALPTPSTSVDTSTNAERARCSVTAAISANDAAFTPSSNAPAAADRRNLGNTRALRATSTNRGGKMPTVASTAPGPPASTYRMNVAVV